MLPHREARPKGERTSSAREAAASERISVSAFASRSGLPHPRSPGRTHAVLGDLFSGHARAIWAMGPKSLKLRPAPALGKQGQNHHSRNEASRNLTVHAARA